MSAAALQWRRGTHSHGPSRLSRHSCTPLCPWKALEVPQTFLGQMGAGWVFTRPSGSLGSVHLGQSVISLRRLPAPASGLTSPSEPQGRVASVGPGEGDTEGSHAQVT